MTASVRLAAMTSRFVSGATHEQHGTFEITQVRTACGSGRLMLQLWKFREQPAATAGGSDTSSQGGEHESLYDLCCIRIDHSAGREYIHNYVKRLSAGWKETARDNHSRKRVEAGAG